MMVGHLPVAAIALSLFVGIGAAWPPRYRRVVRTTTAFVQFAASHAGSSNFIVWVYDIASDDRDLIANEIGPFSGTQVEALDAGKYVVDVTADGMWTLDMTHP